MNSTERKAIAARIRQLRDATTQVAFAKQTHTTQQNLSRYERGQTLPSSEGLIMLSKHTGVSIDWLLFGRGAMWV